MNLCAAGGEGRCQPSPLGLSQDISPSVRLVAVGADIQEDHTHLLALGTENLRGVDA